MKGSIIVFEGLDRSGKSTQVKKLLEHLENVGQPATQIAFPFLDCSSGKLLIQVLTGKKQINLKALHLLFTANRFEMANWITEQVQQKNIVVIDRYYHSGIAYSVAKGLDKSWCTIVESGLPRPDLVVYLDVDPEEASTREDYGNSIYEKVAFQQEVKKAYNTLMDDSWLVIDAHKSPDEVHKKIKVCVNNLPVKHI